MPEKYIEINGSKLWTLKCGEAGPPVVLISGGPGVENYLSPLSEMLSDHCQVIMFDPRGCGRSSYEEECDLETSLQDLERIRRSYGFDKWVVVGHSWGADVALAYALNYPESIYGMISISGTGVQNDRDWKEVYKRGKLEVGEVTPGFEFDTNKSVHRSLINSWRTFIKQPSLLKDLSNLDLPTRFIFAENDIRPSWPIEQISQLIEDSNYIEVKGAEHYIWFEQPSELKALLIKFIREKVGWRQ